MFRLKLDPSRAALAIAAIFALLYVGTLGVRPLLRHDEFRYAEIPREMLASGDFVTPRLNGLRYFEKPVFGYWSEALSLTVFGENRFGARMVSVLSTGLCAWFMFVFVRRETGRHDTAALAAFIYLTSLLVFVIGTFNVLDPELTLWLTLTIGFCYRACTEQRKRPQANWLAAAGITAGLAFLTKGPLGFVIPGIVMLPYLLWRKQASLLPRFIGIPAVASLLLVAPWAVLIQLQEPDFWHYFIWNENLRRFGSETVSRAEPAWFFIALLPLMILPWTFLVPAAIAGIRRIDIKHSSVAFLLFWFVIPFCFFSIARAKLVTYILPCLPPLAMLLGIGLHKAVECGANRAMRAGMAALSTFFVAGIAGLLANTAGTLGKPLYDANTEADTVTMIVLALAAGAIISAVALLKSAARYRHWLGGLSICTLLIVLPFSTPESVRLDKMPGEFLHQQAALTRPDAILVASGTLVHTVDWEFRRNDVYLLLDPGELRYGV
ncbi:MAG TPA: phospholipid carrier-dependent glycosyltransferase, partial [Chromatiales bacterium]|nr:phospholipid carrier-dependent glycosyltransferase [Chromatiales bacterium]